MKSIVAKCLFHIYFTKNIYKSLLVFWLTNSRLNHVSWFKLGCKSRYTVHLHFTINLAPALESPSSRSINISTVQLKSSRVTPPSPPPPPPHPISPHPSPPPLSSPSPPTLDLLLLLLHLHLLLFLL